MTVDRSRALASALAQIERAFGRRAVLKMGERKAEAVPVISSGSLSLDLALGIGGYPRGRIVEIYGPESSGKSTLALHAVAEAQKAGGTALYIDAEHALDPRYARALGVDVDALLLSQPDDGEQALEIADRMVASGAVDVVVVDSVAALVPRAELEGEMGEGHVGLHARLMSQALRKLTGTVARTGALVIFINQIRCLAEDSWVLTSEGLKEIRDVRRGDLVRGEKGWTRVLGTHHGEVEQGLRIGIENRPSLRLSAAHRQTVLCRDGRIGLEEVRADALAPGCWIAYPAAPVAVSGREGASSEAEALLFGMVFALKSRVVSVRSGGRREGLALRVAVPSEEGRAALVEGMRAAGVGAVEVGDSWVSVGGEAVVGKLRAVCGAGGPGAARKVPPEVRAGSSDVVRAFLRGASLGMRDASEAGFSWKIGSEEQARVVWSMLTGFGIFADWQKDGRGGFGIRLRLTGEDARRFGERIGFVEPGKAALALSAGEAAAGENDRLPAAVGKSVFARAQSAGLEISGLPAGRVLAARIRRGMDISRPALLAFADAAAQAGMAFSEEERRLLSDFRFSLVKAVGPDAFRCVDLEVEEGRFVAEGALTHNSKIGVLFGPTETTTGGNALKFYASVRIEVRRIETVKDQDTAVGNRVRVKVVKNKMAPPFREAVFEIVFGKGVSRASEILEMGVAAGIVEKSGSWYAYDGRRIGHGAAQAKAFLAADPETARAIADRIRGVGASVED